MSSISPRPPSVSSSPSASPRAPRSLPSRPPLTEDAAVFHYKVVARIGQKLFSIYDGQTEYQIGTVLRQDIGFAPHTGGFYVYRTSSEAMAAVFPSTSSLFVSPRVLLRCLAWGHVRYYGDRLCFECVRPVAVLELPIGYRSSMIADRTVATIQLAATRAQRPAFLPPHQRMRPNYKPHRVHESRENRIMSLEATIRSLTVTPSHIPFPIRRPQSAIPHYQYTSSLQRSHQQSPTPPTQHSNHSSQPMSPVTARPMSASSFIPMKA